jgi:LacI family transcriptional regulator
MPRASRPTLAEVAAAAGVSLKQASRALNGEYGVSPTTSAKVLEAATRLGFRPNTLARSLASGKPSSAIGHITSDLADPFFAAVAGAIERVADEHQLQILIASHHDDPEAQRRIARLFVERRVDALIVVPAFGSAAYLQVDIDHGLPIVSLDRPLDNVDVDTVVVNNREASAAAVAMLADEGHRRIGLVARDRRRWTTAERITGYYDGIPRAGLDLDPTLVAIHPHAGEELALLVTTALTGDDPATALLASDIRSGRLAMHAARRLGAAPTFAIFDDISNPELLAMPPIVIESDPIRLGRVAAEMAIERIGGLAGPGRQVVLTCHVEDTRSLAP